MKPVQALIYHQGYRYQIDLDPETVIQVSGKEQADLFMPLHEKDAFFIGYNGRWFVTYRQVMKPLKMGSFQRLSLSHCQQVEVAVVAITQRRYFDLLGMRELYIGQTNGAALVPADARFSAILRKRNDGWLLLLLNGTPCINNQPVGAGDHWLGKGDELAFGTHILALYPEELHASAQAIMHTRLCEINDTRYRQRGAAEIKRAPRVMLEVTQQPIEVQDPLSIGQHSVDSLFKMILPPLTMVAATAVMAIMRSNGWFVLLSASTTLISMLVSVLEHYKRKQKREVSLAKRASDYRAYLLKKAVALHQLNRQKRDSAHYHYPDVNGLFELVANRSYRIYEKSAQHPDFLECRIGVATRSSDSVAEISAHRPDRTEQEAELSRLKESLISDNATLSDMPLCISLRKGPVGFVGPRPLVVEQLKLLICQLAVLHSYLDLQLVAMIPEDEKSLWEWLRWLPHINLQPGGIRAMLYNQASREQVLPVLREILEKRKRVAGQEATRSRTNAFPPHLVILVADPIRWKNDNMFDHYAAKNDLSCTLLFVSDELSSLDEQVQTIIEIYDRAMAKVVLDQGQQGHQFFTPDHFPEGLDIEGMARSLAPLKHVRPAQDSLPESLSFMQLYDIQTVEQLAIEQRWREHTPVNGMRVPIGLKQSGESACLDLHEQAHGPHGLVAGTTGSGKSELLQTYILSLCVNFHPHEVAFLLIDYKGGGLANLFAGLPHLLGSMTNLDLSSSARALASIRAELRQRQQRFAEAGVNHIDDYQRVYQQWTHGQGDTGAEQAIPHLFLVCDEFAELKREQPDFMKELVSIARIGRSLGIHLILATQKPAGVVDDQIWSNSRFKICLRVAEAADSMEMLKTSDAAHIRCAGRCYLQVGNGEVYEQLQSAWSGAPYHPDPDRQPVPSEQSVSQQRGAPQRLVTHRHAHSIRNNTAEEAPIYRINDLGQYEELEEAPVALLENLPATQQASTQLSAILQEVSAVAARLNLKPLSPPWLPPLKERIVVSDVHPSDFRKDWRQPRHALRPVIGVLDLPDQQRQPPFHLDLTDVGHLVVCGGPGYGKSTCMQTLVLQLARMHTPEQLHVYLLDFGTNGLQALSTLPHTADLLTPDQEKKIAKFILRMTLEQRRRKAAAAPILSHDVLDGQKSSGIPAILIVIDGFEGLKGGGLMEPFEEWMGKLIHDSSSGIHLILSVTQLHSLRMSLWTSIKGKIVLKQIDDSQVGAMIGRTPLTIEDLPGRGLVKLAEATMTQIALPVAGKSVQDRQRQILREAAQMDAHWTGQRPEPIPVVPERLAVEAFGKLPQVIEQVRMGCLPLGLDIESVQPVSHDFSVQSNLAVFGDQRGRLLGLKRSILNSLKLMCTSYRVLVVDSAHICKEGDTAYWGCIRDAAEFPTTRMGLLNEIATAQKGRAATINTLPRLIYITDIEAFEQDSYATEEELATLLRFGAQANLFFILAGEHRSMSGTRSGFSTLYREWLGAALFCMKASYQEYSKEAVYLPREAELEEDSAYLMQNNQLTLLRHLCVDESLEQKTY